MKKLMKLLLSVGVIMTFSGPGIGAVLINVNFDITARTESTLDGPIWGTGGSDVGTTWNQLLDGPGGINIVGTDLLDSTGAATTVDLTTTSSHMWAWGNPDLEILTAGV